MGLVSSKELETNIYELEIAVDGETFLDAVNKVYLKEKNKINVPGFRKGKAPRAFIERYFGEKVFYEDALELLYPEVVEAAIEEAKLEPVDSPTDLEVVTMEKTGVEFKLKVTVKPQIEIGEYKGLKATKASAEVSQAEIEAKLEDLQKRNARMVTSEKHAEKGDTAVIDFEGFLGDEPFEGGKGEGYSLELGSGQFIPGFEDQVIGHQPGEAFDVNVTFPEEYHEKSLAGQPVRFKVTLHEIKVHEYPELDDEFAKDVSEYESLAELKESLGKEIAEKKEKDAQDDVENQLIDQVIEGLQAEIPEVMYENRVDENVRDFDYRMQMQGMNLDTFLQYSGQDLSSFRKTFREQAEKQVKIRLALEKIVELEGIVPAQEEIDAECQKVADSYKMELEKVRDVLPIKEIEKDIAVRKAIDLVKDNAVITQGAAPASEVPESEEKPKAAKTTKKAKAENEAANDTEAQPAKPARKPRAKKTEE